MIGTQAVCLDPNRGGSPRSGLFSFFFGNRRGCGRAGRRRGAARVSIAPRWLSDPVDRRPHSKPPETNGASPRRRFGRKEPDMDGLVAAAAVDEIGGVAGHAGRGAAGAIGENGGAETGKT
jgi:hypothetical protein